MGYLISFVVGGVFALGIVLLVLKGRKKGYL